MWPGNLFLFAKLRLCVLVLNLESYKIELFKPVAEQANLDISKVDFSRNDLFRKITLPKKLSLDLCYLIGAHIGDGSMNIYRRYGRVDYNWKCCGHPLNDRNWYDNVLVKLYKNLFNLPLSPKTGSDGTYFVAFRSKVILGFYNRVIGLPFGKKSGTISIPKIILASNLQNILACISGVFDTDFCIRFKRQNKNVHHYPIVDIKTKSLSLVQTISSILDRIKISYSTGDCSNFDVRVGKVCEKYFLTISGKKNVTKWFELIGSRNLNHLSKYLIWRKFGFCPPKLNLSERQKILDGTTNPVSYYNGDRGI